MKIKIQQFLGQSHSWSNVGWGLATSLIKLGHDVHLFATDGIEHLPSHLKPYLIGYAQLNEPGRVFGRLPDISYDMQFSYTCIKNFPIYLKNGDQNRFGMWSYEWIDKNILPLGFAKCHKSCDKLFVPSTWSKQGFINSGVPENKIVVLPHGIDTNEYSNVSTVDLDTKKSFKVLANIAQLHKRKNIDGLLDAWGKAFTKSDDVCLILKTKFKDPKQQFDVSLKDCFANFNHKYPDHAEVKVFQDFLNDISSLYRSVDAVFTMTHCEAFYMPGIEAVASGKINIAPKHGGQLDFLNESNSLFIDGKIVRADSTAMYWESKYKSTWFKPSIDDAVEKLRFARDNFEELNGKISSQKENILTQYSWDTIARNLLECCV
jgi:glycosyltransferase involved in cell wall biosynthesis